MTQEGLSRLSLSELLEDQHHGARMSTVEYISTAGFEICEYFHITATINKDCRWIIVNVRAVSWPDSETVANGEGDTQDI